MVSRRDVVRGGLAVGSGLALCRLAGAQAASPGIRLGVASYSLRTLNPAQVIAAMRRLGTPYLNLKDVHLPMETASEVG